MRSWGEHRDSPPVDGAQAVSTLARGLTANDPGGNGGYCRVIMFPFRFVSPGSGETGRLASSDASTGLDSLRSRPRKLSTSCAPLPPASSQDPSPWPAPSRFPLCRGRSRNAAQRLPRARAVVGPVVGSPPVGRGRARVRFLSQQPDGVVRPLITKGKTSLPRTPTRRADCPHSD